MKENEPKPIPKHYVTCVTPTILDGEERMLVTNLPILGDVPEYLVARFILDMVEQNSIDKRTGLTIDGFVYKEGKPTVMSKLHENFMRGVKKAVMQYEIDNLEKRP